MEKVKCDTKDCPSCESNRCYMYDKNDVFLCGAYHYSPTNADRIRAMNDEELAELLCTADWCESCGQTKQDGTCAAMELDGPLCKHCVTAGLKWLKKPAEED